MLKKFLHTTKNTLPVIFLFSLLFVAISTLQKTYDNTVSLKNFYDPGTNKYILPAFVVKNFSFGFNNALADAYWINIIQDLSDWDRTNDFYIEEFRNLSTLDPTFSYPYLFGILTIASKKFPDGLHKFEPVANIGIQNLPNNWEIPFYMGTEFHLLRNFDKALYYIEIASSRPNIPLIINYAYSVYKKRTLNENSTSQELIKTIYDTTESKTTKKILSEKIILNDLNQAIRSVVEAYKNKYGKYPASLDELIEHKLIQITPELKNNFNVYLNSTTGDVLVKRKKPTI